jgi:hypothetical protein
MDNPFGPINLNDYPKDDAHYKIVGCEECEALRARVADLEGEERASRNHIDYLGDEVARLEGELAEAMQALTGRTVSCGACIEREGVLAEARKALKDALETLEGAHEADCYIVSDSDVALIRGALAKLENK